MKSPEKDQRHRFEEAAREAGCDEDPKAFDRLFGKIVPPKLPTADQPPDKRPNKARK